MSLPSVLRRHPVSSGLIVLLVIGLAAAVVVFVVGRDAGPERGDQAARGHLDMEGAAVRRE